MVRSPRKGFNYEIGADSPFPKKEWEIAAPQWDELDLLIPSYNS